MAVRINVEHFIQRAVIEISQSIDIFSWSVRDDDWSVSITRVHQMAFSCSDMPNSPSLLRCPESGVCEEIRGWEAHCVLLLDRASSTHDQGTHTRWWTGEEKEKVRETPRPTLSPLWRQGSVGIAEDSRTGIETGKIGKTIPFAVQTDNLIDYTYGLPSLKKMVWPTTDHIDTRVLHFHAILLTKPS